MDGYQDSQNEQYVENDLEAQEIANMLNGVQKENDIAPEIRELQGQDDDDDENEMGYLESEEKQQILRGGQNIEEENDDDVDQEIAMQHYKQNQ